MTDTPDAVLLYIPLMKGLGMSWIEIKETPRHELEGLLAAYAQHENFHSMDGYDDEDVSQMAKNKPSIRQSYNRYLQTRAKYEEMIGKRKIQSLKDLQ
tara:strand:- start:1280 stop:1573 length:294 start_codon:yes stop_codon:yes gene_type:complete